MKKKVKDIVTAIITIIFGGIYVWGLYRFDFFILQNPSMHILENILSVTLITVIFGLPVYGIAVAFIEFLKDDFMK